MTNGSHGYLVSRTVENRGNESLTAGYLASANRLCAEESMAFARSSPPAKKVHLGHHTPSLNICRGHRKLYSWSRLRYQ